MMQNFHLSQSLQTTALFGSVIWPEFKRQNVRVKFGDSRSKRSRDIRAVQFVMDDCERRRMTTPAAGPCSNRAKRLLRCAYKLEIFKDNVDRYDSIKASSKRLIIYIIHLVGLAIRIDIRIISIFGHLLK